MTAADAEVMCWWLEWWPGFGGVAAAGGNDFGENVRTKRTMRTKPAGKRVMEIMPGKTRLALPVL
jgi:hypothetical protein